MLLILQIEQIKLKRYEKIIVLIQNKRNQPVTEILLIIKGMNTQKIIIKLILRKNRMELKVKSSKARKSLSISYPLKIRQKSH